MRKYYSIFAIAVTIVSVVFFVIKCSKTHDNNPDSSPLESINIDLMYIGHKSYDESFLFYEFYGISKDFPITWWDAIGTKDHEKGFYERFDLELPIIDYSKNNLLISFGRMIHSVRRETYRSEYLYHAVVVFEEEHHGNKAFFYETPKIHFAPSTLSSPCYIFDGEKEEYIGNMVTDFFNYKEE